MKYRSGDSRDDPATCLNKRRRRIATGDDDFRRAIETSIDCTAVRRGNGKNRIPIAMMSQTRFVDFTKHSAKREVFSRSGFIYCSCHGDCRSSILDNSLFA